MLNFLILTDEITIFNDSLKFSIDIDGLQIIDYLPITRQRKQQRNRKRKKQKPQGPAPQMYFSIDIDGLQGPETERYIFKSRREKNKGQRLKCIFLSTSMDYKGQKLKDIYSKVEERKTRASASNVFFYRHRWITKERDQNIRNFNEKYIFVIFLYLS